MGLPTGQEQKREFLPLLFCGCPIMWGGRAVIGGLLYMYTCELLYTRARGYYAAHDLSRKNAKFTVREVASLAC